MSNDFLQKLVEEGRIKEYSEVKDTDPNLLEDNCPEFYVGENIEPYGNYDIGDIVFIQNYKYNNGKEGHNHLFVIIGKDNYAVPLEYFCMLISSKVDKVRFRTNILLKKDKNNNLMHDSIVKTDEIYKIKQNQISNYIGKIDEDLIERFIQMYKDAYE